jgi:fumarylacetoacetase
MSQVAQDGLDRTHAPETQSWVHSANTMDTDFPIQNLPFGRFRTSNTEAWCIGVGIGSCVLDLQTAGLIDHADMGKLLSFTPVQMRTLRRAIWDGLRAEAPEREKWAQALWEQSAVHMGLPCSVGDFTDFYTGIAHAKRVGAMFRPDQPLMPNYKWVPIGYHGRASSVLPSGQNFHRPRGQTMPAGAAAPVLRPSQKLDYELELAIWIGQGNDIGHAIGIDQAHAHIAGISLLNDWSARDIQAWEYQPLGPFLAKNFASTVSPWIVTLDALAPFRCAPVPRSSDDPQPLPYLYSPQDQADGSWHIELEVWLQTQAMREAGIAGQCLSRSGLRDAYWTVAQLVSHHTVGGCNLRTGDLLGTGTLSGPLPGQEGSLLELSQGGRLPLRLGNGETRSFLHDGDCVTLRAFCEKPGARRIGFGGCSATVLAALEI